MAREFVVTLNQEQSRFSLSRLQRDKLYGRKRRVVIDEAEQECVLGQLAVDGSALLPPGGLAQLYIDAHGESIERDALVAKSASGELLAKVSSTLGVAQPLLGPVAPARLLEHVINAVYQLDPVELQTALQEQLDTGAIYETTFAYRDGYEANTAFLMHNEEGYFALIGIPSGLDFVMPDSQPSEDEELAEEEDELDFSMM